MSDQLLVRVVGYKQYEFRVEQYALPKFTTTA